MGAPDALAVANEALSVARQHIAECVLVRTQTQADIGEIKDTLKDNGRWLRGVASAVAVGILLALFSLTTGRDHAAAQGAVDQARELRDDTILKAIENMRQEASRGQDEHRSAP